MTARLRDLAASLRDEGRYADAATVLCAANEIDRLRRAQSFEQREHDLTVELLARGEMPA